MLPKWEQTSARKSKETCYTLTLENAVKIVVNYPTIYGNDKAVIKAFSLPNATIIIADTFDVQNRDDALQKAVRIAWCHYNTNIEKQRKDRRIIENAIKNLYPELTEKLGINCHPLTIKCPLTSSGSAISFQISDEDIDTIGHEWQIRQLIAAAPNHIARFIADNDLNTAENPDSLTSGELPSDFFLPNPKNTAKYRQAAENLAHQFLITSDENTTTAQTWQKVIATEYAPKLKQFFATEIAHLKWEVLGNKKVQRLLSERLTNDQDRTLVINFLRGPHYSIDSFVKILTETKTPWDVFRRFLLAVNDESWEIYVNALLCDWGKE